MAAASPGPASPNTKTLITSGAPARAVLYLFSGGTTSDGLWPDNGLAAFLEAMGEHRDRVIVDVSCGGGGSA